MTSHNTARNQLDQALSPYLQQHARNPVHWREWSDAAFAEAETSGKPVLLSIGYAACHWCHVMAHESFENEETARLMNELFVNIKVDREERPDIDQIYMTALHAMGEQGGWPLTMFLDAERRPFWGGTYFPPEPRFGRPGFRDVLSAISKAWREERDTITANSQALIRFLAEKSKTPQPQTIPGPNEVAGFQDAVVQLCDSRHGGIGTAPKFPNAPLLYTLLHGAKSDAQSRHGAAFLQAMTAMSKGGIYDHIGGGLARYSVDEKWLVPHFEKMLYDNAHFIDQLCWAYRLKHEPIFRRRVEETIGWLHSDLLLPSRGFAASMDADSEGEEGKYYIWSKAEIREALGSDADLFCRHYDVSEDGNFEGRNIPNLLSSAPSEEVEPKLDELRRKLLEQRRKRIPPARDDKVLTDWNGYLIAALTHASYLFQREDWSSMAIQAYEAIASQELPHDRLAHGFNLGQPILPALLSDYASMIRAALALAQYLGDDRYIRNAQRWTAIVEEEFSDGAGGFYLTASSDDGMIVRPRADGDDPNPSPAALMMESYVRLAAFTNETRYLDRAEALGAILSGAAGRKDIVTAGFHNAVDMLQRHRHILFHAENTDQLSPFYGKIRLVADPAMSFQYAGAETDASDFLGTRLPAPGTLPCAIVCSAQTCSAPLSPEVLLEYIR